MKKIYDSFYRMQQNDSAVSLEIADSVVALPNPSSVPISERGDVYIVTAPNGGYLSNGSKSNLSDDWVGTKINATNIPTLVNAAIIGNNIVGNATGASFTTQNIVCSPSVNFSTVDVNVKYTPAKLTVGGTAGNISLSGQPLSVGTKLLVTVNGTTFETTVTTLGVTSITGYNWTARNVNSSLNSDNWCKVLFDGTKYVLLSGGGTLSKSLAYSTDGENWQYKVIPIQLRYSSMVYSGSKYVAIASGSNSGFVSTNLDTFTPITLPATKTWSSVIWTGTKFYAIAQEGNTAWSTDGVTWTGGLTNIAGKYSAVAFGAGKYVAVQGQGSSTKTYATSTDGVTWTQRTLPTLLDASTVAFLNNKFFITAKGSSTLLYSSDGINWIAVALPKLSDWSDITFGGGEYMICSANSSTAPAFRSSNLTTWTSEVAANYQAGDLYDLTSICYGSTAGFVTVCKTYDKLLTRNTITSTTGNTYSPAIVGLPSSVVVGGQSSELSFISGATPPTLTPITMSSTAPDSNGVITSSFSLRGPATQFQFKFNLNFGDSVSEIEYILYEDSTTTPVKVLNAGELYSFVTDGSNWYPIGVGETLYSYPNPINFPVPGNPGTTYMDSSTNITYRWNPVTNSYETVGDGRLWQYPNRSAFPVTGLEYHFYLDKATGVEYYWDATRMAYISKGGGDTPLGTVLSLFGTTAPAGYLLANGSAYDITAYPFLHTWLQNEYPGYISGTLPDLRNMHLRGTDGSRAIGDYQADAILDHSHDIQRSGGGFACASVIGSTYGLYPGNGNFSDGFPDGSWSFTASGVTGATTAAENRVKNKAVNFFIKAVHGHTDMTISTEKEVFFYSNYAAFPGTGEVNKVYTDKSNNKPYYWSGTAYVSLGWAEKNAFDIKPVSSSPFNYTTGTFLDVRVANAIINLPVLPIGQSIIISNSSSAINTVINTNINGATSNNSLKNPYNTIELVSVGTEYRIRY